MKGESNKLLRPRTSRTGHDYQQPTFHFLEHFCFVLYIFCLGALLAEGCWFAGSGQRLSSLYLLACFSLSFSLLTGKVYKHIIAVVGDDAVWYSWNSVPYSAHFRTSAIKKNRVTRALNVFCTCATGPAFVLGHIVMLWVKEIGKTYFVFCFLFFFFFQSGDDDFLIFFLNTKKWNKCCIARYYFPVSIHVRI